MPHLTTRVTDGHITLTPFLPTDAPILFAADHDPEMRLRFEFPPAFVPSLDHTLAVIARWAQERAAGERFPFAVRAAVDGVTDGAADGVLVGGCELWPRGDGVANVSYWTYAAHRRAGFASRAVALLCDTAFGVGRFTRLEIVTDPDNVASKRVALRNGFFEVGMRGEQVLHVRATSGR
ncbi:MAG: GNAT family N-acetyltransferase [Ardenticatenales bacterium]